MQVLTTYTDSIDPPSLLNLKVGQILHCERHENAEKLYVLKVQVQQQVESETNEPLQICSGLVQFIPREDLLNKRVIVLANLKASKMRGVKSEAMLLAAEKTSPEETKVELVNPPTLSIVGDSLYFGPFQDKKYPSKIKSKVWEEIQKHLKTNSKGEAMYFTDEGDECLLQSERDESTAYADTLTDAIIR